MIYYFESALKKNSKIIYYLKNSILSFIEKCPNGFIPHFPIVYIYLSLL